MTGTEIYAEAKSWQTGIASLLGFTGIIIGALWNFHLNRRRDIHIREEEVRSIAAAFYGEISILRMEISRIANNVAYLYFTDKRHYETSPLLNNEFLKTNRFSKPVVLEALTSKLGLLPVDVVIQISRFYQNRREAEYYLPILQRKPENKVDHTATYVLEPARDAVRDVEATLIQIEDMLKIKNRHKTMNLDDVDCIIELENQFFDE